MDKIEEMKSMMDFVEGGLIKDLKVYLKTYIDAPEEEANKNLVDQELQKVIEIADINKKA
jgi:hypothetical protein